MLGDSVRRRNQGSRPKKEPVLPRPDGGRRVRWKVWGPVLAGAAILPFLIGYAIAIWLLFPPPEVVSAGIAVPSLRGRTEAVARQTLAAAGLGGIEVTYLPHPELRAGTILAQSPLTGQQLRAGAGVRVAVSSGVARALVPDVVGFQAERARALLERLGFVVTQQEEESPVQAGRVTAVEPGPGSQLPLPATVRLIVSTGPPPLLPDTGVVRTDTTAHGGTSAGTPR